MREVREREFNSRAKAIGGLIKDITNLGKEMERDQDEAGIDGDAFASADTEVHRHASDLYGVR